MMLKYAVIIDCQFKNTFPIGQVPVVLDELGVIVNTLLTGSLEFPCSSFHTWTLQFLQQFTEFRNVQETLAGTTKEMLIRKTEQKSEPGFNCCQNPSALHNVDMKKKSSFISCSHKPMGILFIY